jgi:molybdenum cofactor cytidylyltransferase
MICGVLLAAGLSRRMGRPKQLLDWQGRPLIRHVAEQALAGRLAGLWVVLGAEAEAARAALAGLPEPAQLHIIENPDYAAGQATSLRAGLAALPVEARAAMILLVDQPLVGPTLINSLIESFPAGDPTTPLALIPQHQGRRGNPVLLNRAFFPLLQQLEGDQGARQVLRRYPEHIHWLDIDDPAVVRDIDTPEAYQQLQQHAPKRS